MAFGPKYYNINGICALKLHYLGPWTLNPKPYTPSPHYLGPETPQLGPVNLYRGVHLQCQDVSFRGAREGSSAVALKHTLCGLGFRVLGLGF